MEREWFIYVPIVACSFNWTLVTKRKVKVGDKQKEKWNGISEKKEIEEWPSAETVPRALIM